MTKLLLLFLAFQLGVEYGKVFKLLEVKDASYLSSFREFEEAPIQYEDCDIEEDVYCYSVQRSIQFSDSNFYQELSFLEVRRALKSEYILNHFGRGPPYNA